jgi:ATP-dependent DNA helicase RecG
MHTTIEMFYDRMVVESPGPFPPFITPENIYDTQHARNPKLMDAMIYLGLVKFANEGTKRIREEMLASNLPMPLFQQSDVAGGYSVRLTLRNNYQKRELWIDSDVSSILGEAVSKSLSPEESRAINFIKQHGQINVSQRNGTLLDLTVWLHREKIIVRVGDHNERHRNLPELPNSGTGG